MNDFAYTPRQLAGLALLAAAYYVTSKFGFSLAYVAEQVTVVWPPAGIALAAALLFGPRLWPGIFLGAFLTNATANEPLLTALGIATGNTLEALAGSWLMRRYIGPGAYLLHVRGVLGLVFFCAVLAPALSATIGALSLCLGGVQPWEKYGALWLVWWLGDAGGMLIVAPLLLAWSRGPYALPSPRRALEAAGLAAVTLGVAYAVFRDPGLIGPAFSQTYLVFPALIWAAVRFDGRGVTLVTFLFTAAAVWFTSRHIGPFSAMPAGEALNVLQAFCIITGVTGMMMGAAMSERSESGKLESQLRRRLDAVLENMVDGLVTIDEWGIVRSYNKACAGIFGYAPEEVIGRNARMLMPPEHAARHERYVTSHLRAGRVKIVGREIEGRRKDGSTFPMDVSVAEMSLGGARVYSAIIRDISDRKEREGQLLKYTQELRRSNQELDDFAYIASHDLKEPLRGLLTQASFLLDDYQDKLDAEGIRRLRRLAFLSQRLEKLISDLLYFSRLGRTELAVQETDPNDVVAEIRQMLESFLRERNARVVVPKPMPRVAVDRLRLAEIFRNLIANAVKYNDKPERLVEVGWLDQAETPQGAEHGVFYVRDNGIGIAAENHEVIFRIFKRLDDPAVKAEEGTGSGLTFVKKIIERHKGRIWLDSVPGKGSTFYFTLGRKQA